MIVGAAVTVTKLAKSKYPVSEPGNWENWNHGGENADSLPVDYQMRGYLLKPVEVGGLIVLFRLWRNGVTSDGIFTSSPIMSVKGDLVETFNSIYRIADFRETLSEEVAKSGSGVKAVR
jgi:hypothetical protein